MLAALLHTELLSPREKKRERKNEEKLANGERERENKAQTANYQNPRERTSITIARS